MCSLKKVRLCLDIIRQNEKLSETSTLKRVTSTSIRCMSNKIDICANPPCQKVTCKPDPPKADTCVPGEDEIADLEVCPSSSKDARIIIIGAGMAGLSAAHTLQQAGINNFAILEALDRPGGRIHSQWLGDTVVELGSQWGDNTRSTNPILQLAIKDGFVKPPLNQSDQSRGLFLKSDGGSIDLPLSLTAYQTFKRIWKDAYCLNLEESGNSKKSILQFLGVAIQQELKKFPRSQQRDAARLLYGLVNLSSMRSPHDSFLLKNDHFGSYIKVPDGRMKVPLGYVGILNPMLSDISPEKIIYGKPVHNIRWGTASSSFPRALVKCCDGDVFPADYVLVTIPLGVLQATSEQMFCPGLPSKKINAIHSLCFGHINKMFLEFDKPFWIWWEGGQKLTWSAEEMSGRNGWLKGICNVETLIGSNHIMCVRTAGPEVLTMEKMSEAEVMKDVVELLCECTGGSNIPDPVKVKRSNWSCNRYFNGAYSYLNDCCDTSLQYDLAAPIPGPTDPVPPILLFAGEATCPGQNATVHGAKISGIREAERISELILSSDKHKLLRSVCYN